LKIKNLNWTARFAVALVFCLIFVGGLVTSWQAGMAVPDWPLSFGSLNPEGWWANFPVRLEHGHRLLAACVGIVVGVLCAAVWGNWRALGVAVNVSIVFAAGGSLLGAPPWLRAHLGIWPAAAAFVLCLTKMRDRNEEVGSTERSFALGAFVLVCFQATLGGLRVTQETAGWVSIATVLRVVHGCVAQAFLAVLIALAVRIALLAKPSLEAPLRNRGGAARSVAVAGLLVYMQLILGASMRHLGAGLAIPTFPAANPEGGWLPKVHNLYTDLNFTHTRVGALIVTGAVLFAVFSALRNAQRGQVIWRAAARSGVIVVLQATLGILVVLHQKPKTLATFHVVLGAALLASLVALFVRILAAGEKAGTVEGHCS
jgi:cytochrome c oxidase assembly protein subunit 15